MDCNCAMMAAARKSRDAELQLSYAKSRFRRSRGAGRNLPVQLEQRAPKQPLFGSIAQNSFQGDVEIAPHLCYALIAILTEERRWLIIFKNSPALLVLKQNHPQRRAECSRELMASLNRDVRFTPKSGHGSERW